MKIRSRRHSLFSRLHPRRPNRSRAKPGATRRATSAWVGRDLAPLHRAEERQRRFLPVLLIGGLIATLGLTALRIDLIRQRYALAAAMGEERRLLEEHRMLTAQVRSLRDPARLTALAHEMGFVRPGSVIQLPSRNRDLPGPGTSISDVALGPRP